MFAIFKAAVLSIYMLTMNHKTTVIPHSCHCMENCYPDSAVTFCEAFFSVFELTFLVLQLAISAFWTQ